MKEPTLELTEVTRREKEDSFVVKEHSFVLSETTFDDKEGIGMYTEDTFTV